MYSIELSGHGTSAKFNISASQHISDGSNSTTKEMRSHEGVIELITILDKYIPIADIVSSYLYLNLTVINLQKKILLINHNLHLQVFQQ